MSDTKIPADFPSLQSSVASTEGAAPLRTVEKKRIDMKISASATQKDE